MTKKRKLVVSTLGKDEKELVLLAGTVEYELHHKFQISAKKLAWTHQLICLALGNPKFTGAQKRNCILRIFQSLVMIATSTMNQLMFAESGLTLIERKSVDHLIKTWIKTVQDETAVLRGLKSEVWDKEVELKLLQRHHTVRETNTSISELMNRLHFFTTVFLCFFGLSADFPTKETKLGDALMAERLHIDSIGTWQQLERIVCLYVFYRCSC